MKIIVSGFLFACLISCGQVPEQSSEAKSVAIASRTSAPMLAFIKRIAAHEGVAVNVADAVSDALTDGSRSDKLRAIISNKPLPRLRKYGTIYLDDPYLSEEGSMIVHAQGLTGYHDAKKLLDSMTGKLSETIPAEFKLGGISSVSQLRQKITNLKKDLSLIKKKTFKD